jgi:hypothetical protein
MSMDLIEKILKSDPKDFELVYDRGKRFFIKIDGIDFYLIYNLGFDASLYLVFI